MEEINDILALFDAREKWDAFIELSSKKDSLVNELKNRLAVELKELAEVSLIGTGWSFEITSEYFSITPLDNPCIKLRITWDYWNCEWSRRGVSIWSYFDRVKNDEAVRMIWEQKERLPLAEYEETYQNHNWFLFSRKIPARVFGVDSQVTSCEQCLYMAKDNARQLAKNIWEEVFQPFAKKEIADILTGITQICLK